MLAGRLPRAGRAASTPWICWASLLFQQPVAAGTPTDAAGPTTHDFASALSALLRMPAKHGRPEPLKLSHPGEDRLIDRDGGEGIGEAARGRRAAAGRLPLPHHRPGSDHHSRPGTAVGWDADPTHPPARPLPLRVPRSFRPRPWPSSRALTTRELVRMELVAMTCATAPAGLPYLPACSTPRIRAPAWPPAASTSTFRLPKYGTAARSHRSSAPPR
jgi:hypothetical protein